MLLLALTILLAVPLAVVVRAGVRAPTGAPLLAYAAVIPFGSGFVVPGPIPSPFNTVSTLLGAWLIVVLVLHLACYRDPGAAPGRSSLLWLAFLGWTAATVLWSVDPSASANQVLVLAGLILSFVLLSITGIDARRLRHLETAIVAGGVACGLYGLFLLSQGHFGAFSGGVVQRFATAGGVGEQADPGVTAASLVLPLTLAVRSAVFSGSRVRAIALGAAAIIFAGILLTGSRGGLLAAVAAVVVIVVSGRHSVSRGAVLGLIGITMVGAVLFAPSSIVDRIQGKAPAASTGTDVTTGRNAIWSVGARSCRTYCLVGAGFAGFPEIYRVTLASNFDIAGHGTKDYKAHNIGLTLLIETGIVGALLAGAALVATYRSVHSQSPLLRTGARAGISGVVVANMFVSNFDFKYFWLALTYAALVATVPINRPAPGRDVPAIDAGSGSSDSSAPARSAGWS